MKWVLFGVKHGSEEKSQVDMQDDGGIEDGLMKVFNDFSAAISAVAVVEMENGRWMKRIRRENIRWWWL